MGTLSIRDWRFVHILLLVTGIGTPLAAAIGGALGQVEVAAGWSIGFICAAVVAVFANLRAYLPAPNDVLMTSINRVLSIVSSVAAVAYTVAALLVGQMSAGTKGAYAAAMLSALFASLRSIKPSQGAVPVEGDPRDAVTPLLPRDSRGSRGETVVTVLFASALIGFFAAVAVLLLAPGRARAAEDVPQLGGCNEAKTVCWQPAVAVTVMQLNLKTGDYARVALNAGYGMVFHRPSFDFGVAAYAGAGFSSERTAPQGNLMFQVADLVAFGPGVQVFKGASGDLIWQALFSVAGNYNIGGSPTYVKKAYSGGLRAAPCAVPGASP